MTRAIRREKITSVYIEKDPDGNKRWYKREGSRLYLHREDGPAVEYADGSKVWVINNQLHREDGPAIEYADGGKVWFINDHLHREDGPAVERPNGAQEYWLFDKRIPKKKFTKKLIRQLRLTRIIET